MLVTPITTVKLPEEPVSFDIVRMISLLKSKFNIKKHFNLLNHNNSINSTRLELFHMIPVQLSMDFLL